MNIGTHPRPKRFCRGKSFSAIVENRQDTMTVYTNGYKKRKRKEISVITINRTTEAENKCLLKIKPGRRRKSVKIVLFDSSRRT